MDTMDMAAFSGDEMDAARDLIAGGHLAVITSAPSGELRSSKLSWPRDVAESIGECAVVPISCLDNTEFRRYPLAAGPKESIRFLCAAADPLPPDPFPYESAQLRRHYRAFRELWLNPPTQGPEIRLYTGSAGSSHVVAFYLQLGERLAQLHSKNVLHGDAHIGNWGVIGERVVVGDNHAAFLSCPPSPAQCATDIYPLLPALDPRKWRDFRLGYVSTWQAGQRVIDQIQLGDRTGWAMAFRTARYAECLDLIVDQLQTETDGAMRVLLMANLALAASCAGRHEDAKRFHAETVELARTHVPYAVKSVGSTVDGVLHIRRGDRAGAMAAYRDVVPDPEHLVAQLSKKNAQIPIVNL
ncbi:hypothetical protein ND748_18360 [Frankia sp. AiPs1]|uniref:hypothetical protein n=1 Tax=Frankia sp. AiPs1 TaxID=573493 RepID=UPI0020436661|nr:hypothetical protein [Frankia sp. AiPs1]MCM3923620.1 hypothetical protein [Frankia sp. AiPs1]